MSTRNGADGHRKIIHLAQFKSEKMGLKACPYPESVDAGWIPEQAVVLLEIVPLRPPVALRHLPQLYRLVCNNKRGLSRTTAEKSVCDSFSGIKCTARGRGQTTKREKAGAYLGEIK